MHNLEEKQNRLILAYSFAIFAFFLIYFSYDLGSRVIYTRGEGREGLVVKSMIEQHNFVLPLRGGNDIPSKPPMFHWLSVLTYKISGHLDGFALRFPSAISASATILLIFLFSSFYYNIRIAVLTTLILSTAFEFSRNASNARVDMCFTFFLSGALITGFLVLKKWSDKHRTHWKYLFALTGFLTGGILTKGPTGFIIPLLILSIYFCVSNRANLKSSITNLPWIVLSISLLASILLAGVWYWLAFLEQGQDFLNTQIFKENLSRIAPGGGAELGHNKPFYLAPLYLLTGFLPWSLFLPVVIGSLYRKRRNIFSSDNQDKLFLLIWVLLFLIAVTFSNSKRIVYFLPAYPALALLFSLSIQNLKTKRIASRYLMFLGFLGFLSLSSIASLILTSRLSKSSIDIILFTLTPKAQIFVRDYNELFSSNGFFISILISLAFIICAIVGFYRSSTKIAVTLLSCTCLLSYFSVCHWILPIDSSVKDCRNFVSTVEAILDSDDIVTAYKHDLYSARFYFNRHIAVVASIESLRSKEANYVLVADDHVNEVLNSIPGGKIVAESLTKAADGDSGLVLLNFNK